MVSFSIVLFLGFTFTNETKKKISEKNKGKVAWNKGLRTGMHFYTNGIETITAEICPEGFWPGRTFKNKPTGRPKKTKLI